MFLNIISEISWYLLFFTTIISFIYRKRFGAAPMKYIPYYLIFISLVEIIAILIKYSPLKYNVWWYNIMANGIYLFYLYLYYHLIESVKFKIVIKIFTFVYIVFYFINYLFLSESWNTFQSFPFSLGSFLLLICVFWYLIELFKSDEVMYIGKMLSFWISIGLLFHLIIQSPSLISATYFKKTEFINNQNVIIFSVFMFISNILMYIFYLIGIWNSKLSK